MGNTESVRRERHVTLVKESRRLKERVPPHQGDERVRDYANRYASPFNRTQFRNHSASQKSNQDESVIFSCVAITNKWEDDDDGNFSCISVGPDDAGAVSTLYDVEADAGRQIVWEYQRYSPQFGWGAGNFDDPGDLPLNAATNVRFASHHLEKFGDSIQSVAPLIPAGWQVDLTWTIVVQRRRKRRGRGGDVDETGLSDKFGWRYGKHFNDGKWLNVHEIGYNLRRRAWSRVLMKRKEESFEKGDGEVIEENRNGTIGEE